MAKLIITDGGRRRIYEILEDSLFVGRSPENQIQIKEQAAGRVHCEIRKTAQGFQLVDLETKGGTKVNGQLVNHHLLQNGDRIEIGTAEIAFEGGQAPRIAPREDVRLRRAKKGLPGPVVGLLVGGGAALAVLIIAVLAKTIGGGVSDYWRLLEEADTFIGVGELVKAERKLKEFDALDIEKAHFQARVGLQEKRRHLQEKIAEAREGEKVKERGDLAVKRFKELQKWVFANTKDPKGQLDRIEAFRREFADHRYAAIEAVKMRDEILEKIQAEEGEFPKLMESVEEHIKHLAFGKAEAAMRGFVAKFPDSPHAAEIDQEMQKLYNRAEALWLEMHQEAQGYLDAGNRRKAREIYERVKREFDMPAYVRKAETELARIGR